jgi:hypothetical protein
MIFNATLIRLDGPPPDPQGPLVEVRCALTEPTVEQAREILARNWAATHVAYIPEREVPSPRPVTGGQARIRADGGVPTSFRIVWLLTREARTLGHVQLYLGPP